MTLTTLSAAPDPLPPSQQGLTALWPDICETFSFPMDDDNFFLLLFSYLFGKSLIFPPLIFFNDTPTETQRKGRTQHNAGLKEITAE